MTTLDPLVPLQCVKCGAFVPLGQSTTARCAYCGTETPIPASYLAAQRAAEGFADDRALAESLYGKIGKPPGRAAMLVGGAAETTVRGGRLLGIITVVLTGLVGPLAIVPLLAIAWLLGYPTAKLLRWFFALIGDPVIGAMEPAPVLFIAGFILAPIVAVPTILLRREQELVDVRRDVHASLACAPPERPGGPARCRSCGAALDVRPGALGVACAYCRADNLVALPPAWVERARSQEFQHFLRIDGALEAYRRASEHARERAWRVAFFFVFVEILLVLLGLLLGQFPYY